MKMLGLEGGSSAAASLAPAPTPEQIAAAERAVEQQAAAVRRLKAGGQRTNSDPQVQAAVQVLVGHKAQLAGLLEQAAVAERAAGIVPPSSSSPGSAPSIDAAEQEQQQQPSVTGDSGRLDADHPFCTVAIWQLPVLPLFFAAERSTAKLVAKELVEVLKGQHQAPAAAAQVEAAELVVEAAA